MGIEIADHETAAVKKDQRGQRIAARRHRRINAQRDIAARSRHRDIFDLADGTSFGPTICIIAPTSRAHRRRHLPHFRARLGRHLVEKRFDEGIERHRELRSSDMSLHARAARKRPNARSFSEL